MTARREPGECLRLALTGRRDDVAVVRVLADLRRDLAPHAPEDQPWPLAELGDATLVEVRAEGRMVLPGAWVAPGDLGSLTADGTTPIATRDLRMPAHVVAGTGAAPWLLAWGETRWALPFDRSVAIPAACRPGVHSVAQLRRLVLVALGRPRDVGLTLWQRADFQVPWHDVRLVPRARWWFDMAQIPAAMRYADAARSQGLDPERFLRDV